MLRIRLNANAVSCAGAFLCGVAGVLAATWKPLPLVGCVFGVGVALDMLDGRMARLEGTSARRMNGGLIDSLADHIGESALFVGLILRSHEPDLLRLLAISAILGLLTSYVKAAAFEHHLEITWPEVKVFGRAIRATLLGLTLITTGIIAESKALFWGLSLLVGFNVFTFVWRVARSILAARA
jgi:phosphatidylglycerophosphate synthase